MSSTAIMAFDKKNSSGMINNSPIGGYSQSSEDDSLLVSPVRESISSSLPINHNNKIMIHPPPNLVHDDDINNTVDNNNSAYGWKHVQDLLESDNSNDGGYTRRPNKGGRRRRKNYNNSNSHYNNRSKQKGDNDSRSSSGSDERIEFNLLNSTPSFIEVGTNNSKDDPTSQYYSPRTIKKRHSHGNNNNRRMPYASTPNTKSMFIGNGSKRNNNQSTYIPQHLRRSSSSQKEQPMSNVSQQQAGRGYNSSVTQQRSTQRKSLHNMRYNQQHKQQRRTPTKPYSTPRRSSYNHNNHQSRSPPPQPRQQPIPEMLMRRQPTIQTSNVQSYNTNNDIGGYENPLGSRFYQLNESTYTNNNSEYSPRDVPIPTPDVRTRSVQQHNVTSIEAVSQQNSRVYHHPFEADYLNPNMSSSSRPSYNHEYGDKSYDQQHREEEEDEYTPRSQPIPYPEVISSGAASSAASLMQQFGSPSKKLSHSSQPSQAQTSYLPTPQSTSSNSSRYTSQDIHHQLMMQPSPTRSISTSQSTRSHLQFSPTIRSSPNNNTTISEINDFSQLMSTVNASYPSPDRSYYSDDNSSCEYDSSSPSKSLFSYWLPPSPTKGRNGVGAKGVFDVRREEAEIDESSSFDTNAALYGDIGNSTSYDTSTPAEARRKKKSYTVAQSPTSPKSFIPRKSPHPTSLRNQVLPSHSEQKRLERLDETYEEVEPRVAPQPEPRSTYFLNDEGQDDESSHDEDEHLRINERMDVTSRLEEQPKKKQTQRTLLWESDSDSSSSSSAGFRVTSREEDIPSVDCSDLVSVDTDVLRKELDVSLDTRIKRYSKMHHGFVLLQALARGTSTRMRIAKDTDTTRILKYVKLRDGFILLQAQVRGVLCRSRILADSNTVSRMERYAKLHAGFVSFQAIARGVQARKGLRTECQTSSQMDRYARATNGFIALQARVRGVILRSRIFHTSAIKIQALVRGVQHRMVVERMKETKMRCIVAATVIQREIRRWRCRSQFHKAILYKKSAAATSIQASYRGWKSRVDLYKATLATKIQRCYRRHQSSLHDATNYRSLRVSLAIQSIARMYIARKNYLTMKEDHDQTQLTKSVNAAIIIQAASRSWKCQRELLQRKTLLAQELQNSAATTIQSSVRLWSRRKALLLELEEKTAACTLIQSVLRSRSCQKELVRRRINKQVENEEKASTIIQAMQRSWICQQELSRRRKVIIRQRQEETQRTHSSAVTTIQSQVRSWKVQRDLALFTMSAATIQRCYRRHSQYTIVKQTNLKLSYADKLLKSCQVAAAITIQSVVRACICKEKLLAKKAEADHQAELRQGDIAASTIQARLRGWKSRTEMDSIVVFVIKIQRYYRRHQSSLRHARNYHSLRGSLIIQSVARMYLARKKFISMKKHHDKTQLVLSIWECQRELVRRKEEADREMMQVAVVKIQSLVRSWRCRRDLLVATNHALMIQRCYRKFISNASNKHQLTLTSYADELWKSREVAAATLIQSVARSWICQRELSRLKDQARQVEQHQEAAITSIQSVIRSWLCQQELLRRRYIQVELYNQMTAATTIQSIVRTQRSKQELLKRREAYQTEVDAATLIQSVVRSLVAKGVLCEQRLAHRVATATIIQSVVRSWKCQRDALQEIENREAELNRMQLQASLVIQASARMYIASKKLVMANRSALMIQNTWRIHCGRASHWSISDDYASTLRNTLHLQSRLRELHELTVEESSTKSMDRSVCILQARWRGAYVRQQISLLIVSALAIQSLWRRFSEKRHQQNKIQHYQTTLSSITRIQSDIKRKIADSRFKKLSSSAKSIQQAFKTYMTRKCFLQVHHSIVVLQSITRRWLVRKVLLHHIKSCVIIQRAWWTYIFRAMPPWSFVKANYHHLLAVDGSIRESIPKRSVLYLNFHHSVILLQRMIRGHLVRCQVDKLQRSRSSSPLQTDNIDHTTTSSYSGSSNVDNSDYSDPSVLHSPQVDNNENENPQLDMAHSLKKHDVEDIICIQSLARCKILSQQITAYNLSATIIQNSWRKFMSAKDENESYQRYHVLLEQAVILTQRKWRVYIRRQREIQHNLAATKLQAINRSWSCRRKVSQMLLVRAQEQEFYETTTAAIVIQSLVRPWMCRNDLAEMRKRDATLAATTIQALARRWICQSELLLLRDQQTQAAVERRCTAATYIQTQVRSRQCRRSFSQLKQQAQAIELNQRMSIAATTIQSSVRVWLCQQDLSRRRKERIHQGQEILQRKSSSAATTIQALVRSHQCQHELSILTKHAVKIQRYYRRYSHYANDMARLKMSYADELWQCRESNATITLQAVARSWLCRITLRREQELSIKEQEMVIVVKIQSLVRSWRCRRDLLVATNHALMIQRCYRKFLSNASNKNQLRLTLYADELWKSREVTAATLIQSVARSRICQRELNRLKEQARQVIEQHQEAAVILIQSMVRSWISQKEVIGLRDKARQARSVLAAVKVQALVRSWLCQQELSRRRYIAQVELNNQMTAATTIQSIARIQRSKQELLMRREAYQTEVDAATLIQSIVRSLVAKEILRDHQQRLACRVAAAMIIQSVVRSWKCQQLQRTRQIPAVPYQEDIVAASSVIVIQARIRGFLFRNTFSKANNAARTIQCAWRRCVISLRVKLLQVFTLASREDSSLGISTIPFPMKKARVLLPRDSQRLNRIRDITPHLPRHHECGIFVEEIMNSVTVVIQSAARRYLAKQKVLKHRQTITSIATLRDPSMCEELIDIEEHDSTMRFSSEDEDILILADIYEHVQAELPLTDSSYCVAQCAKR